MKNQRRQADLLEDLEISDSTHLGPEMEAKMGMGLTNAPINIGSWKGLPPDLDPFARDEMLNKVGNRKKSESQGEREARLARRLLVLLRQRG